MSWAVLWAALALAGEVTAVTPDGPLMVGQPGVVHVAVVDELGRPAVRPPRATLFGESLGSPEPVRSGIWRWSIPEPAAPGLLQLTVRTEADEEPTVLELEVEEPPRPAFSLPDRVEAVADAREVVVPVRGAVSPGTLRVSASEGTVVRMEAVEGGVDLVLRPDDLRQPRFFAVGVHLVGEKTRWTAVRLRARQRFSYQLAPGDSGRMQIGSRTYGPVKADAQGRIEFNADIYPGDSIAELRFEDDLGNPTEATLPLTPQTEEVLALLLDGELMLGRRVPTLELRVLTPLGRLWSGDDPSCLSPSFGDLTVRPLSRGSWTVSLPADLSSRPVDLRVICRAGASGEASIRVPVSTELPARLKLTVRPTELSADLPVADVQAVLEDATGQPMPAEGVSLRAARGEVVAEPRAGFRVRGEYRGEAAVQSGEDVVTAAYTLPGGTGPVNQVLLSHGPVPAVGEASASVEVRVRLLDAVGRPLVGRPATLRLGDQEAEAVSSEEGWATAMLPLPPGRAALGLAARADGVRRATLAFRGEPEGRGPGMSDLEDAEALVLLAGRARTIEVEFIPNVLYTTPGAVALVRVVVLDRNENRITDEEVAVVPGRGDVGALELQRDGSFLAEYSPPEGASAGTVGFEVEAGDISSRAFLELEPRPVRALLGPMVGGLSNLGQLASPMGSLDLDVRLAWLGGQLMVRGGLGVYWDEATVSTGIGEDAVVQMVILPFTAGLSYRPELPGAWVQPWIGAGLVVAPYFGQARFGEERASQGLGILPPGAMVFGGVGRRLGQGEVQLELRGLVLVAPGGELAWQGQVGGVSAVVGYRFTL